MKSVAIQNGTVGSGFVSTSNYHKESRVIPGDKTLNHNSTLAELHTLHNTSWQKLFSK